MSLEPSNYIPRLVDAKIEKYLRLFGAVSIEGPKWCGKTWAGLRHANTVVDLDDEMMRRKLETDREYLFDDENEPPVLVDEWTRVPEIWDSIRKNCDLTQARGRYILTCSTQLPSVEEKAKIFHSGAGRIARVVMRPMSLAESEKKVGVVSLTDMLNGVVESTRVPKVSLKRLAYYIVRGGWPANIGAEPEDAGEMPKEYLRAIIEKDISRERQRSGQKMMMILRSLARNEATIVTNQTILRDIAAVEEGVSHATLDDYLDMLGRLHVIEDQPAFSLNYRSSARVGRSAKRHFVDPSLACAALDLSAEMLWNDLRMFGFMFEALVERDLRIYMDVVGGKVYHFRDSASGDEVDAIVEFPSGEYGAIEIKLGENGVMEGARSLARFSEAAKRKPRFLCVIVGNGDFVYREPETGAYVVPVGAMKG